MKILNIAGGKILPLIVSTIEIPYYLLSVDTSYYSTIDAETIENDIENWKKLGVRHNVHKNINYDIVDFLGRTSIMFDHMCLYRFLEHISFTDILYFIYLVSTATKPGATVDVIVPNYEMLADMLKRETTVVSENNFGKYKTFENWNTVLTTELLNEPSCPHASIWTPYRAKYFWELEGRFKVTSLAESFEFDGRDIYMRFICERLP